MAARMDSRVAKQRVDQLQLEIVVQGIGEQGL